jgi:hypothetical protein
MPRKKQNTDSNVLSSPYFFNSSPSDISQALSFFNRLLLSQSEQLQKRFSDLEWSAIASVCRTQNLTFLPTAIPFTVVLEHLLEDCKNSFDSHDIIDKILPTLKKMSQIESITLFYLVKFYLENIADLENKDWWKNDVRAELLNTKKSPKNSSNG